MGKQINYFIDYDNFILLAQKALDIGCKILKEDLQTSVVIESDSTDIISRDCSYYYFYIPETGKYRVKKIKTRERIDYGYNANGLTMIEASMSTIIEKDKMISRGRLYVITGYYDGEEKFIKCPDLTTKIYNTLTRYVKKIAPYTEVEHYVLNPMYSGEKILTKEYITTECLAYVEKDNYKI